MTPPSPPLPAFAARVDGGVVRLTGADRARYLEDVTSQHVLDLAPGHVVGALHLDAHGAPLAVFDVVALDDAWLLLVPDADLAAWVVRTLGARTFLLEATFEPTDLAWLAARAPADRLADVGLDTTPGRVRTHDGLVLVGVAGGVDVLAPPTRLERLRSSLADAGVPEGGPEELEAWRVAVGRPAWGRELVAPHLPEETGLLPTHVHLAKGCYPGQEAVARMWMLGRPRRRLATVALEGAVASGWSTGSGRGRVVVTSAVGPHGLAYVPPGTEIGERFRDGGRAVRVTGFVGGDTPPPGHDPAMSRRRDRRSAPPARPPTKP